MFPALTVPRRHQKSPCLMTFTFSEPATHTKLTQKLLDGMPHSFKAPCDSVSVASYPCQPVSVLAHPTEITSMSKCSGVRISHRCSLHQLPYLIGSPSAFVPCPADKDVRVTAQGGPGSPMVHVPSRFSGYREHSIAVRRWMGVHASLRTDDGSRGAITTPWG